MQDIVLAIRNEDACPRGGGSCRSSAWLSVPNPMFHDAGGFSGTLSGRSFGCSCLSCITLTLHFSHFDFTIWLTWMTILHVVYQQSCCHQPASYSLCLGILSYPWLLLLCGCSREDKSANDDDVFELFHENKIYLYILLARVTAMARVWILSPCLPAR